MARVFAALTDLHRRSKNHLRNFVSVFSSDLKYVLVQNRIITQHAIYAAFAVFCF